MVLIMGIKTAIKGLFSSTDIIDKGAKGLDALHYSKEESAADNIEMMKAKATLFASSTASAITRRLLAFSVGLYWLLCQMVSLVCLFVSDAHYKLLSNHIDDSVNQPFIIVIMFYFGTAAIGKLKS